MTAPLTSTVWTSSATLDVDSYAYALANGYGGHGTTGGAGTGGLTHIEVDNATVTLAGISSDADGRSGTGTTAGVETGGKAEVLAKNGGTLDLSSISMSSNGSGGTIDIRALQGGKVTATSSISADTDGSLFLSDDGGLGAITAPTLYVFTANITGLADAHITNLYANLSGDSTLPDINVPGYVQLLSTGNLTLGKISAGNSLYVDAGKNLFVHDVTAPYTYFYAGGRATFVGIVSVPSIYVSSGGISRYV